MCGQAASWRVAHHRRLPGIGLRIGALHVYIGRPSLLRDAATDEILLQAQSLRQLLRKAANTYGCRGAHR
jgi:hypothetical protein